MKFNNEAERLQHPIASRIPALIWEAVFMSNEISDFELGLLEEKQADTLVRLTKEEWQERIQNGEPARVWLLISIFFSPPLTSEQLKEIADKLNVTLESQLYFAAMSGNQALLEKIIETNPEVREKPMVGYQAILYQPFRLAGEYGYLGIFNYITVLYGPEYTQWMIAHGSYQVFLDAARRGQTSLVKQIIKLCVTDRLEAMLKERNYAAFRWASMHGHVETMKTIVNAYNPNKRHRMIAADQYFAFSGAAKFGHIHIMKQLILYCRNALEIKQMIAADNYRAFRDAAATGEKPAIMLLIELSAPKMGLKMVEANDYASYRGAAENNHVDMMKLLELICPASALQNLIAAGNYGAFRLAAKGHHASALHRLLAKCSPDKLRDMLISNEFEAFNHLTAEGDLPIVQHLIALSDPDDVEAMLAANNYRLFRNVVQNGGLPFLNYIVRLYGQERMSTIIAADNYAAFSFSAQVAVEKKDDAVLNRLIELCEPANWRAMVASDDYGAFAILAEEASLVRIKQLVALLNPEDRPRMVAAKAYRILMRALRSNDLERLNYILSLADRAEMMNIREDQWRALNFNPLLMHITLPILDRFIEFCTELVINEAMHSTPMSYLLDAKLNKSNEVLTRLFALPSTLAAAESHASEFPGVTRYIDETLQALRNRILQFEQDHPNGVFNIDGIIEARRYFYIMRNLIRRNSVEHLDMMRMLLGVPAVKALAHSGSSRGNENELLRFAMSQQNTQVVELLLTIPAVRTLAARHQYYRQEQRGGIDLADLARNSESSMMGLTTGESKRLNEALRYYQPLMKSIGIPKIMGNLRDLLQALYQQHPAEVKAQDKKIVLPMSWADFQKLGFQAETKEEALKAYYQNKYHSAFRYLSKPNRWMHPRAQNVCVGTNTRDRWANFEEYEHLIVLFFLAASDKEIKSEVAVVDRQEQFIDELAHIGRAHNWDRNREKVGRDGAILTEEYDDLQGDRPSCFGGVKRRLFQSVPHHPMLMVLTREMINQELHQFVREHYIALMINDDQKKIEEEWDLYEDDFDEKHLKFLAEYDLTPNEKDKFIEMMQIKYRTQFDEDFKRQIESALVVKEQKVDYYSHWAKFFLPAHLKQLISASLEEKKPIGNTSVPGKQGNKQ